MQHGSQDSFHATITPISSCVFCQHVDIAAFILKETANFLIVADHAPLVEGHILIIPKLHYDCFGTVPPELDAELKVAKDEVQLFFEHYYAPIVFWEHGIFRQTVFHAHLHCFPFGPTNYEQAKALHNRVVHSQEDIRTWFARQGHYFYLEEQPFAYLFAPEIDRYMHIVKDVLWNGVTARTHSDNWRSQQQRQFEGGPLIQATKEKWQLFQRQGEKYAGETSTR